MQTWNSVLTAALAAAVLAGGVACAPTQTRQSTGEVIDDSALTARVKAALVNEPGVKSTAINVETFRGTVSLSGFVDSAGAGAKGGHRRAESRRRALGQERHAGQVRLLIHQRRESEPGAMRVRHALVAIGLAAAAACAGLPVLEPAPQQAATARNVRVAGAGGALPPRQAAAVVRELEREGQTDLLARHLAEVEHALSAPLVRGNEGKLLIDGPATHRAMFDAIGRARNHVNLQTYIIEDDEVGQRLADLLIRKRGQGVSVNVLYDSVGSNQTPGSTSTVSGRPASASASSIRSTR